MINTVYSNTGVVQEVCSDIIVKSVDVKWAGCGKDDETEVIVTIHSDWEQRVMAAYAKDMEMQDAISDFPEYIELFGGEKLNMYVEELDGRWYDGTAEITKEVTI